MKAGTNLGLKSNRPFTLCMSLVKLLTHLHFGFLYRNRAETPSSWDTPEDERRQPADLPSPILALAPNESNAFSLFSQMPGSRVSSLMVPGPLPYPRPGEVFISAQHQETWGQEREIDGDFPLAVRHCAGYFRHARYFRRYFIIREKAHRK